MARLQGKDVQHDLLVAKVSSMFILGFSALLCAALPIIITRILQWRTGTVGKGFSPKVGYGLELFLRFGGGILLATTFLHLLPEVREGIERLGLTDAWPLQIPELVTCIGFFIMYGIEEMAHLCLHMSMGSGHHHHHTTDNAETSGQQPANQPTVTFPAVSSNVSQNEEEPCVSMAPSLIIPVLAQLRRSDLSIGTLPGVKRDSSSGIKGQYEGHSHVVSGGPVRGLLIIVALSVHQVFEGLAVGLESSPKRVWVLLGAVAAHKLVIALAVGAEAATAGVGLCRAALCVLVFAVASPIGIGLGLGLSHGSDAESQHTIDVVSVVLQGLATGTLVYVVFFEVLVKPNPPTRGLPYCLATFLGFCLMIVLLIFFDS